MASFDVERAAAELSAADPRAIVRRALEAFSPQIAISFSGAEDVILIDMASRTGIPFRVVTLDTGRLPPETLEFVETVRKRYGLPIEVLSPQAEAVQALVRAKGLFSF